VSGYSVWVYVHVLLFVYWLGADLGVFLLARAAKRRDLSFAERAFALRMALAIDVTPRLCFALMFPVGLQLVAGAGVADVPGWLLAGVWLLALGWIALLFVAGRNADRPLGITLGRLNLAFQAIAGLAIGAVGLASALGRGPFPPGWLAWKVLLFALVFASSIGIDLAFRPVAPAFARLASDGSSPAVEAQVTRGIDGAIRYVLALYVLIACIAFLGVAKPL
jgi:hypothetical protein